MLRLASYGFEYMTRATARRIAKEDFCRDLFETRQNIFENGYSAGHVRRIFKLQYDENRSFAKMTKLEIPALKDEIKKSYQAQFVYFNTYANLTKKYIKKYHMLQESKFNSKYDLFKH